MSRWTVDTWKPFAMALLKEVKRDRIGNGAAALAFYMMLALFPAAIFCLSLFAYLPIPNLTDTIMSVVDAALPSSAAQIVTDTLSSTLSTRSAGLLTFGLLFAIWSASDGLHGLIQELNVVYDVEEQRSTLRVRGLALLLMLAFMLLIAGVLVLVVFGHSIGSYLGDSLGWSSALLTTFTVLRWGVILGALQLAFAFVYWLGPNEEHSFAFVAPGPTFATVSLVVASVGFQAYVSHFGRYDALYGGLGAVIVLLIWLFLVGWVILLGAEIDQLASGRKRASDDPAGGSAIGVRDGSADHRPVEATSSPV